MIWIIALACTPPDDPFSGGGTSVGPLQDTSPYVPDSDSTPDSDSASDTGSTTDSDSTPDSDSGGPFVPPGGEDCGTTAGDIACNLKLIDQDGNAFALWDTYGDKVVFVAGNAWNSDFVAASGWLQGVGDKRGATVFVAMYQDANYTQPGQTSATSWANAYGLDSVLYDPGSDNDALDPWFSSQTKTYVIGTDLKIDSVITGYVGEEQVNDKLKGL